MAHLHCPVLHTPTRSKLPGALGCPGKSRFPGPSPRPKAQGPRFKISLRVLPFVGTLITYVRTYVRFFHAHDLPERNRAESPWSECRPLWSRYSSSLDRTIATLESHAGVPTVDKHALQRMGVLAVFLLIQWLGKYAVRSLICDDISWYTMTYHDISSYTVIYHDIP